MQLYWQGKDITKYVSITGCLHRESSHGESDLLDISMDHAETWHKWAPETDDMIRVVHQGYDTGTLYLHALIPDGKYYRVLASSTRAAARQKKWAGYRSMTLKKLIHACAVESGMSDGLYGTEGNYLYPWMERRNEGTACFIDRLCRAEGIALKCIGGGFRAIDILWAQGRDAAARITVNAGAEGARWYRNETDKWSKLIISTPWAESSATDSEAGGRPEKIITGMAARDSATAGRWARGLLLDHNREAESLEIDMGLSPVFQAMEPVTVEGNTAASGDWMVDRAEHDLMGEKTSIRLLRSLWGIR